MVLKYVIGMNGFEICHWYEWFCSMSLVMMVLQNAIGMNGFTTYHPMNGFTKYHTLVYCSGFLVFIKQCNL
jgi:hypothetical protein